MKYIVFTGMLLVACTATKSTLDFSPKYKVGDSFGTDADFYLGSGVLRVTAVSYSRCFGVSKDLQWVYLATLHKPNGDLIDDVEVCESDLK